MRIDAIHTRLRTILDEAQAGQFSREQIDEALDIASISELKRYLKVYAEDMDAREALSPFKTIAEFVTDDDGKFFLQDSQRLLRVSVAVMTGQDEVKPRSARIINEDKLDGRLNSQLREVSIMYPIVIDEGIGNYRHYPKMNTGGTLAYIKRPAAPKFAYNVVDDEEVYNHNNSNQLEWGDKYIDQIIFGAIAVLGIPLDNAWLVQNGYAAKQ